MGEGINNAQREKEVHGKKCTKQLNPQKKTTNHTSLGASTFIIK
jgi:hypothetical protein